MRLYLEKALFFSLRAGQGERFLQPHQGCMRLWPSRTCLLHFKLFSGFKYMKGKFVGTSGFPSSEGFRAIRLLFSLFLPLFLSLCSVLPPSFPSSLPPPSLQFGHILFCCWGVSKITHREIPRDFNLSQQGSQPATASVLSLGQGSPLT